MSGAFLCQQGNINSLVRAQQWLPIDQASGALNSLQNYRKTAAALNPVPNQRNRLIMILFVYLIYLKKAFIKFTVSERAIMVRPRFEGALFQCIEFVTLLLTTSLGRETMKTITTLGVAAMTALASSATFAAGAPSSEHLFNMDIQLNGWAEYARNKDEPASGGGESQGSVDIEDAFSNVTLNGTVHREGPWSIGYNIGLALSMFDSGTFGRDDNPRYLQINHTDLGSLQVGKVVTPQDDILDVNDIFRSSRTGCFYAIQPDQTAASSVRYDAPSLGPVNVAGLAMMNGSGSGSGFGSQGSVATSSGCSNSTVLDSGVNDYLDAFNLAADMVLGPVWMGVSYIKSMDNPRTGGDVGTSDHIWAAAIGGNVGGVKLGLSAELPRTEEGGDNDDRTNIQGTAQVNVGSGKLNLGIGRREADNTEDTTNVLVGFERACGPHVTTYVEGWWVRETEDITGGSNEDTDMGVLVGWDIRLNARDQF